MEQNNKATEKEIHELGLNAIRDYFQIDVDTLDKDTTINLHNKARLAMSFTREFNVSKRAVESNYIRVFRMMAEDKKELKKYIKAALPKYYVV